MDLTACSPAGVKRQQNTGQREAGRLEIIALF